MTETVATKTKKEDSATQNKQDASKETTSAPTDSTMTNMSSNSEQTAAADNMITIPKRDYERLLSNTRMLSDLLHRIDHMIMTQKQVVSITLKESVTAHNMLADLEGAKDAIFLNARVKPNGN